MLEIISSQISEVTLLSLETENIIFRTVIMEDRHRFYVHRYYIERKNRR